MTNFQHEGQIHLLQEKIKHLEKELEKSKQKSSAFEEVLNSGKIGVLSENSEGDITYINDAFKKIFNIPNDLDLVGQNCMESAKAQSSIFVDESKFHRKIEKILQKNKPVFDDRLELKDGRILNRHFIPNSSDNILMDNIWIYFDATDFEALKKEAKHNKAQLELFFNQSLTGFFFMMLDEPIEWNKNTDKEKALDYIFEHQRVTKVNQAFLDQYLAKEEEFIGFTPNDFFSHDLVYGRKIWSDFFDKGHWHVHTHEKKFDGTDMIVDGDYICLYDDKGRITGQFGIQQDVTEQEELKRKNS